MKSPVPPEGSNSIVRRSSCLFLSVCIRAPSVASTSNVRRSTSNFQRKICAICVISAICVQLCFACWRLCGTSGGIGQMGSDEYIGAGGARVSEPPEKQAEACTTICDGKQSLGDMGRYGDRSRVGE